MKNTSETSGYQLPDRYTTRPALVDDAEIITNLINRYSISLYGQAEHTIDQIKRLFSYPKFNLETSSHMILNPNNELVGIVYVIDFEEPPIHPILRWFLHPDYWDTSIADYLHLWGEQRAHDAIARCPDQVRVSYVSTSNQQDKRRIAIYEKHGMKQIRYFWSMRIERPENPPDVIVPDGITIRMMDHPDEFEQVVFAFDEAFKDHWGHVEQPFEKVIEEMRERLEHNPNIDPAKWWLVAVDDASGEIAGCTMNEPKYRNDNNLGYIDVLAVRRAWRKRGLGLALLQSTFNLFWENNKQAVTLTVDADSLTGATRLYEKAGMHIERQNIDLEKELRAGEELANEG